MQPWPADRSVLVMDNCAIHKADVLREVVEAHGTLSLPPAPYFLWVSHLQEGCRLIFVPPYSPDMNPIEESFSACKSLWCSDEPTLISAQSRPICNKTFEGSAGVKSRLLSFLKLVQL
jgi:transposase